jgi:hypothetical protein
MDLCFEILKGCWPLALQITLEKKVWREEVR